MIHIPFFLSARRRSHLVAAVLVGTVALTVAMSAMATPEYIMRRVIQNMFQSELADEAESGSTNQAPVYNGLTPALIAEVGSKMIYGFARMEHLPPN